MTRDQLIQGALGVGAIVLAFVFLSRPEHQLAFTAVSGYGFGLLGRLLPGPGQLTQREADRLAEERVARVLSDPPPRG